jgi:hypothetical protein
MHRGEAIASALYYGYDAEHAYLRIDWDAPPGADCDLLIEVTAPRRCSVHVSGLVPGDRPVTLSDGVDPERPLPGARCRIERLLELAIPFAAIEARPGQALDWILTVVRDGAPIATLPPESAFGFRVPGDG